jgi:hypothetical protein
MEGKQFANGQYIYLDEKDLKNKSLVEYIYQKLIVYDYYEEYDNTKKYDLEPYVSEFIKGKLRKYENHFLRIKYLPTKKSYKYVVAYEILDNNELEILKKYCQCEKHRMSYFNPKRYLIGAIDVGCLQYDIGKYNMDVIYCTRKYLSEHNK